MLGPAMLMCEPSPVSRCPVLPAPASSLAASSRTTEARLAAHIRQALCAGGRLAVACVELTDGDELAAPADLPLGQVIASIERMLEGTGSVCAGDGAELVVIQPLLDGTEQALRLGRRLMTLVQGPLF